MLTIMVQSFRIEYIHEEYIHPTEASQNETEEHGQPWYSFLNKAPLLMFLKSEFHQLFTYCRHSLGTKVISFVNGWSLELKAAFKNVAHFAICEIWLVSAHSYLICTKLSIT